MGCLGRSGLEQSPAEYLAKLVAVFRQVRRVLKDDGICFILMGDTYAHAGNGQKMMGAYTDTGDSRLPHHWQNQMQYAPSRAKQPGLKHKGLLLIPQRLAIALDDDGWIVRQDIIWNKPNVMPESVTDRFTRAHDYVFMLTKDPRYYFNYSAAREPAVGKGNNAARPRDRSDFRGGTMDPEFRHFGLHYDVTEYRNRRSVWTVNTTPGRYNHYSQFPPKLIEPMILCGSRPGDYVLDPFLGTGTTALVAKEHGRRYIGIELKPEFVKTAKKRLGFVTLK